MFRLTVASPTIKELRSLLIEAANGLGPEDIEEQVIPYTDRLESDDGPSYAGKLDGDDDDGPESQQVPPVPNFAAPPVPAMPNFGAPAYVAPVPPPPSAPQQASTEVDSRGLPWDERIHSATKAVTKDGSWRYRRGVDDNLVKQIEGESKSAKKLNGAASHAPITIPPVPPTTVVVEPPTFQVPVPPPVVASPAPQPSYENIPVPPDATKPAHSFETFRKNFIKVVVDLLGAEKINADYIRSLEEYFKVKAIWDIAKDDTKSREMFENFCNQGLITRIG